MDWAEVDSSLESSEGVGEETVRVDGGWRGRDEARGEKKEADSASRRSKNRSLEGEESGKSGRKMGSSAGRMEEGGSLELGSSEGGGAGEEVRVGGLENIVTN